ncbi:MAG: NAD-glutamate dehydrogenase, partial [Candidatus Competibacteraceae bacterium]|nr:NAD-glutamate dehydrogenase [Candidatus Competibacteraceae bacterium]
FQSACRELTAAGAPAELAHWAASLGALFSALDLIEVATQTALPETVVATVYFGLTNRLTLNWLRQSILDLPVANHWQNRSRAALLDILYDQGRVLTLDVLRSTANAQTPEERLESWLAHNQAGVERCRGVFADLRMAGQPDLAMLSVALREMASLVRRSED